MLARPGYRRLWAARTMSQWGDTFNTVALVLLVFHLTGSGLGVSGAVLAEIIPVLVLAPIAGTLVDRLRRVDVMIAADLVRTVLAAILPLVDAHVGAVYAVAFGMAAATVFFNPAAGSVLPALVDDEQLVAANSGIWTAAVLSQVALAPLAGLLVTGFGFAPAFWLNAASFAASAVVLRGLRRHTGTTRPAGRAGWLADTRTGAAMLVRDRLLAALGAAQLLAALSAGATSALLVVLARRHLHLGSAGYGLLLAAIGVGAAAGPFVLAHGTDDPRRPALVFGPFLLRAAVDLVLASCTALGTALAALVAYGVGTSTGAVTFNSLLQAETPEHRRGRVLAGFDMIWQLGRLVSLAVGGVVADAYGIRAVYYLGGALLAAAAVTGRIGLWLTARSDQE